MTTSLSLLGVKGGPAIAPNSSMPTSNLIRIAGMNILVDAGLGVTRGICDQGVSLKDIDLILITHLHSDHYLDLGAYFHTAWVAGLTKAIPVIGPSGLSNYWAGFQTAMAFDINLRIADEGRCDFNALADISLISEGVIYDHNGLTITAMRNVHPPIDETYALKFEHGGKIIVLSGDTAFMPEMIDFAKGADLLVHEVLLESGVDKLCASLNLTDGRLKNHLMTSHTKGSDVGRIAAGANVRKLALNHFCPGADPDITDQDWIDDVGQTWDGELIVGRDGITIDV